MMRPQNTMNSLYGGSRKLSCAIIETTAPQVLYTADRTLPQVIWVNVANKTANPVNVSVSIYQNLEATEYTLFQFVLSGNESQAAMGLQGIPLLDEDEIRSVCSTADEVHVSLITFESGSGVS